jgi:dienelactone hydrolase
MRTRIVAATHNFTRFVYLSVLLFGISSVAYGQDTASSPPSDPCPRQNLEYRQSSFTSGGKTIHVEQFQPRAAGKFPVIIMIHGAGGLLTRHGAEMPTEDNFGEIRIACRGYVALLVHYFDRSGILSTVDMQYMEQQSPLWLETLRQAVDYAASLPKANPVRIGVLGESLGSYLALSLAMRDRRIKAVSEYAGGIQLRDGDNPRALPPVFIQHSGKDSIVPVSEALRLEKVLAENAVPHGIKIYEGLNHYPSNKARAEMEESSIQFFDENLKRK